MRCLHCQTEPPAGSAFCNGCGVALAGPTAPRASRAAGAPAPRPAHAYTPQHLAEKILQSKAVLEGERKQVTVLFADIKGSMELADQVDAEEWHAVLDRFFKILNKGVHRFEGTVNQYTGDGIMALFGAPIAHEDHAQRACYAALHLRDALDRYAREVRRDHGLSFGARIGINSGEVVVGRIGDDLRMDYTAQGHSVGLAQRVEQVAEVGRPYLAAPTAALVEGYFDLEDLGELALKGVGRRRVFALDGARPVHGSLDRARRRGLSGFVGRTDELAALEGALERAESGESQVLGIVAEAGLGKSRLVHEFAERARAGGAHVAVGHCAAHARDVPLYGYIDFLRANFGITDGDDTAAAREKITARFLSTYPELTEQLPFLCEFLGVPDPERPVAPMTPEERQRRVLEWQRRAVAARSRSERVVLIIEDLHWVDSATEAMCATITEPTPARQVFVVTYRPEYRPPWASKAFFQQVTLRPLPHASVDQLLEELLGPDVARSELARRIRERCGGTPFFLEELIQSLAESGALVGERGAYRLGAVIGRVPLPFTVKAVLEARIDRLTELEKRIVRRGSVIGPTFARDVLAAVVAGDDARIDDALRGLCDSELLYEQAMYPEREYAFKHPLTQEVAYESQLSDRRRVAHAEVARQLEQRYADRLDEKAAVLGRHWDAGGAPLVAARWHARAAAWAGLNDCAQAYAHWRKVRELTERLEPTDERKRLRTASAVQALNMAFRIKVPDAEVDALFKAARAELDPRDDRDALAHLLTVQGQLAQKAGRVRDYWSYVREALPLVDASRDPGVRAAVLCELALSSLMFGRLPDALAAVRSVEDLVGDDVEIGREYMLYSPRVNVRFFGGQVLVEMGRLREAADWIDEAVTLARRHALPDSLSWILGGLATLAHASGELGRAGEAADEAMALAEQGGSPHGRGLALRARMIVHLLRGAWQEAIDTCEQAVSLAREHGMRLIEFEAPSMADTVDAYLGLGKIDAALEAADEVLRYVRTGHARTVEVHATVVHARALRVANGAHDPAAVERELAEAERLIEETGAARWTPHIHGERAALARLCGDVAGAERERAEAHRLFVAIGATGHAERLQREPG